MRITTWMVLCAGIFFAANAQAAPDPWVTAKVKMALIASEGVPGAQVHVDTSAGQVTLYGDVPSAAAKARAEEVARDVEGVRSVRNLLMTSTVVAKAEVAAHSDAELKQAVERALAEDHALADSKIGVKSVQDGVVYLTGSAQTFSEHRRAIGTAAGVLGVRRVESDVTAPDRISEAEIGHDRPFDAAEYAKSTASDIWITTAVKTLLFADDGIPGLDINVDASDGRVTLFGTVASVDAKRRAEAEARKVEGVREVENDLQIVPESSQPMVARVDADLAKEVEERIGSSAELTGNDISVQVENAVVRLTGTIDGSGDRLAASTAARSVTGVTRVIDDLQVEPRAVVAR